MNILKWVVVIVVAFAAGYFSHFPDAEPVDVQASVVAEACPPQSSAFDDAQRVSTGLGTDAAGEKTKPVSDAKSAKTDNQEKIATQDEQNRPPQAKTENPTAKPEAGTDAEQSSSVAASNITDEEIDKLVAAPYNDILKRSQGPLREKYKEFAETTQRGSWDENMQNKITDALLGNSYSKFIELQGVICKANLCEIRGRELKSGVVSLIFSEMMLQDWWDIGHSQWTNGGTDNTFYGLLMKR